MLGARRTRRAIGFASIAVAAAAITTAIALPTLLVPHFQRIPADIRADTLSVVDDAQLIDVTATMAGRARTETGVPLRISMLVSSIGPTTDRTVTMQGATRMYRADRTGAEATVSASVDKVTLDRYSSSPTGPPGLTSITAGIVDTTPRRGFQYKLPFGTTDSGRYLMYDDVARVDVPLTYVDGARHENGMRLLHFRSEVAPTNLFPRQPDMFLTLPASYWGLPGDDEIQFDLHYSAQRDIWVEPQSGMIVEIRAHLHRELARRDLGPSDPAAVTTLDAHTRFDEQTLAETLDLARTARTQIMWGRFYGPAVLGVVGALTLLAGILILRRTARPARTVPGSEDPTGPDTAPRTQKGADHE